MARRKKRRHLKTIDTEVLGVEELKEVFDGLARDAQRTVVAAALQAGAQILLAEERRHVPVRTGALRDSLQIFKVRHGKKASRLAVGASPEGWYGRLIEYGTQHMPARPWLRPAMDAAFRPTVAAFREEFAEELDPFVEDLARRAGST